MYQLNVIGRFASAHQLRGYQGKCEHLHGHNWTVDVTLESPQLDRLGMVMDFKIVKEILNEILEELDHRFLNEIPPFDTLNPTTENMARHVFGRLAAKLKAPVSVVAVTCWESDGCGATYKPD